MCKFVLVKEPAASLVPSTTGSLRFPKPENKGKEPTLQARTTAGLGGGYLRNTLADKFLSREVHRKQRISCAKPRRGQAGTGLRSRSLLLPGRGSGVASRRLWAGEGCGRRCESRTPPTLGTSVPKSLLPWPFFGPGRKDPSSRGQGRAQGMGSEVVGLSWGLRNPGGGGDAARRRLRRRSGWLLSSGPLLPPHLSHSAPDLRPSIPGPRGTGPGTGRRRERYPEARRRRHVGAGAPSTDRRRPARQPYLGAAEIPQRSAAARRLPLGCRRPRRAHDL